MLGYKNITTFISTFHKHHTWKNHFKQLRNYLSIQMGSSMKSKSDNQTLMSPKKITPVHSGASFEIAAS